MGSMGFTKCVDSIIDSSVWEEHADVIKVFIAFWTKSNPDGEVSATFEAMYRTANLKDVNKNHLPVEHFEKVLNILLSPDDTSRSKEQKGRRIVRLGSSKWLIVNYKNYRQSAYSDNPESIRKREYRDRKNRTNWDMSQNVLGHSASASKSASSSSSGFSGEEGAGEGEGRPGGDELCLRDGKVIPAVRYRRYVLLAYDEYDRMVDEWGKAFADEAIRQYDAKYPNSDAVRAHTDHCSGIRDYVAQGYICKDRQPKKRPEKPDCLPTVAPEDLVMPDEVDRLLYENAPPSVRKNKTSSKKEES